MSQENGEIVRLAYDELYKRRSVEGPWREKVADEFRFHSRPEFPGRTVYRLDEMPELWADLDDTYTEFNLAPEDFEDVGDYVIVTISQSARMAGTASRIGGTIYHVWHVRDGKAREAWAFSSKAEALEAAGLSE